jgi:two-component system response regulator PilR (NtrC family)
MELFVEHYLEHFAVRYGRRIDGIDDPARTRLGAHGWPGNIRELAHAIEAAVLTCEGRWISVEHLPHSIAYAPTPSAPSGSGSHAAEPAEGRAAGERYSFYGSAAQERMRIEAALRRWRGNKTRAAAELGMARNTLRARLRSHADADAGGDTDATAPGPGP